MTPAPFTLARQASASAPTGSAGGGSSSSSGADGDATHQDLLRHLREEREQLGQLIPHPF